MATREGGVWRPEHLRLIDLECISGAPADREAAERDFGHLTGGAASLVLLPRSAEDIQRVVAAANAHGLSLAPRGRGLSQGGQSLPAGGASLDLSRMARVDAPDAAARTIRCEAGATFRSVAEASARAGLLPPVMPLNPDLTVGGVLSVGGIGAASHRHGPAIAAVESLDVITGAGRRLVCSAEREPEVFEAVLGGAGCVGVIAAATLRLRRFGPRVRTFHCLYDDVDRWLDDQRFLVASPRADHLEAACSPCLQGFRAGPRGRAPFAEWFHTCHVSVEYDVAPPDASSALSGLRPYRVLGHEDQDTLAFVDRYAPRFAAMRRSGAWSESIHPWVTAFVPAERLHTLLPGVLDRIPLALGEGPRLQFLARKSPTRFFRVPPEGEIAVLAFTPAQIPAHLRDEAQAAFRAIHADLVAAGAFRYLSGWLGMMDEAAIAAHFGETLPALREVRRRLDPGRVFSAIAGAPLRASI
jgi:cytokinin dehydrogenase